MEEFPLWVELTALGVLLLISALFSISETSMMALSRLRLRHLVRQGSRSALRVQSLLSRTDRLLGTILLGNNLVNAAATALVTAMAIRLVGDNEWALVVATGVITFLILVFSEITPKVIGATFPEHIALPLSYPLSGFLRVFQPVVWFVNLFVKAMLWAMRIPSAPSGESTRLTSEELRTLVLEGGKGVRFPVSAFGDPATGFVVRYDGKPYAYLNRCAHVPIELDWFEGDFFESSKTYLMCSTHGAIYVPSSGYCAGGPCKEESSMTRRKWSLPALVASFAIVATGACGVQPAPSERATATVASRRCVRICAAVRSAASEVRCASVTSR